MIFPQLRQSVGGLFDRIERATARPAFGLGIGLLSGDPQQGFTNARALRLAREQRVAEAEALRRAQLQQAADNAFRTRALDIEAASINPKTTRLGELEFLFPGDQAAQREFELRRLGIGLEGEASDNGPTITVPVRGGTINAPARAPERAISAAPSVGGDALPAPSQASEDERQRRIVDLLIAEARQRGDAIRDRLTVPPPFILTEAERREIAQRSMNARNPAALPLRFASANDRPPPAPKPPDGVKRITNANRTASDLITGQLPLPVVPPSAIDGSIFGKVVKNDDDSSFFEKQRQTAVAGLGFFLNSDDEARADILASNFPTAEFAQDENGRIVVRASKRDLFRYINAPGIDEQDVVDIISDIAKFAPSAKLGTLGAGLLSRMGLVGGGAGLTSLASDRLSGLTGSEQGPNISKAVFNAALSAAQEPLVRGLSISGRGLAKLLRGTRGAQPTQPAREPSGQAGLAVQAIGPTIGKIADEESQRR